MTTHDEGQPEVDADFEPVDLAAAVTARLVRGESRDEVAAGLGISRADVDVIVAERVVEAEAEALLEREWVVRERVADLTRQASAAYVSTEDAARIGLLLSLARFELELINLAHEIERD